MTEEQKKFLEECENEFADRYTEKDSAFMKIKNMELRKPPIMDPWHNKERRSHYEWSRQNQGHGRRNNAWERRNNERRDNERRDNERRENERGDRYDRHDRHYSHRNYRPY